MKSLHCFMSLHDDRECFDVCMPAYTSELIEKITNLTREIQELSENGLPTEELCKEKTALLEKLNHANLALTTTHNVLKG